MAARTRAPASKPPMTALPPTAADTAEPTVPAATLGALLDEWTIGMLQAGRDSAADPAPNWSGGYGAGLQRAIDDLTARLGGDTT